MALPKGARLLLGFQIMFMVFGAVVLVLRFIAIKRRGRCPQIHDIFCLICYIFMDAFAVVYCVAAFHGMGQHITELSPQQIVFVLKSFLASEFMYNISVIFMRLSILVLYLSLFPQTTFRHIAYAFGTFIILFPVGSMLYLFAFCRPLSKTWNLEEPGSCGSTLAVEEVSGAINLIMDCVLILMPMPIVWRLNMSTQKKVAVTSIFGLSVTNIGINIGRIAQPLTTNFVDFTYSTPGAAILVTAELMTGLLVSCIPTLAPLFKSAPSSDGPRNSWLPSHIFTNVSISSVIHMLLINVSRSRSRSHSKYEHRESDPEAQSERSSTLDGEWGNESGRGPAYQGSDRQATYGRAHSMPRAVSSGEDVKDGIEMRIDVNTYFSSHKSKRNGSK